MMPDKARLMPPHVRILAELDFVPYEHNLVRSFRVNIAMYLLILINMKFR